MVKALRYLSKTYLAVFLGAGALISALAFLCSQVVKIELFSMYYTMLPLFFILFAMIYSFNVPTLYRNTALSFGCRRADFFWGTQAAFVIAALGSVALAGLAGYLPKLLFGSYETVRMGSSVYIDMAPGWFSPAALAAIGALCLTLQPIGAAVSGLFNKSKAAAGIFFVVIMLFGVVLTVFAMFVMDGTIVLPPAVIWGTFGVLAALAVVCDILFYRSNRKAVVRC